MIEMTVLEVLKQARELVKQGWCQNAFAQNGEGEQVSTWSNRACKFCAWGAIRAVVDGDHEAEDGAVRALVRALGKNPEAVTGAIVNWNDAFGRKQIDVIEAFDLAIEQEANRVSQVD